MKQHGYNLRGKLAAQSRARLIQGVVRDGYNIKDSIDIRAYNTDTIDRLFDMHQKLLKEQ